MSSSVATRLEDECLSNGAVKIHRLQFESFISCLRGINGWHEAPPTEKRDGGVEYVRASYVREQFSKGLRRVAEDVGQIAWLWNHLTEGEAKK